MFSCDYIQVMYFGQECCISGVVTSLMSEPEAPDLDLPCFTKVLFDDLGKVVPPGLSTVKLQFFPV